MPFAADDSLDPEGPVAESMADLWWLMLAIGTVVFVLFAVLLGLGLLRRRNREDGEEAAEAPLVRRWIVWGGVVLPTVVLIVVFAATVVVMRDLRTAPPEDALVIEVTGRQWSYEVAYPDHDVVVHDELHLPVGRPVELRLRSVDVIHSLWVPSLGGKTDMLPDYENTMVLEASEPGVHRTHCAEFCGLEHATMRLLVVAEPEDEFQAWLDAPQESAAAGDDP